MAMKGGGGLLLVKCSMIATLGLQSRNRYNHEIICFHVLKVFFKKIKFFYYFKLSFFSIPIILIC
jgi:hypothetical protein